jgi:hypothetical protein
MKKLTKKDYDQMWGEAGPYSEVSLSEQTRILDNTISRIFLVVEAKINPFTFEFILKHRDKFVGDEAMQQLLDHAEFRGPIDGYVVSAGEEELRDQKSFELASSYRKLAVETVLRMHNFVIEKFGLKRYSNGEIKIPKSAERRHVWDKELKSIVAVEEDPIWNSGSSVDSPLGTKNGKMRYFAVFALASKKVLGREDVKWFSLQTKKVAEKLDVTLEDAEAGMGYIMLTVLIFPHIAPADFIETCIAISNKKKSLFAKKYFITNTSRPTGKEIESFLRRLKL